MAPSAGIETDTRASGAFRSGMWSGIGRFGSQLIGFIVTLIMARLLTPGDYGLVAMMTIFVEIGYAVSDSGMTNALIRSRRISAADAATVFIYNQAVSLLLYAAIFFSAPLIARFYEMPELVRVARVIGLNLPLRSLGAVARARFIFAMDFRRPAAADIAAGLIAGIAGISLAAGGRGVMSIVIYQVLNAAIATVVLWSLSDGSSAIDRPSEPLSQQELMKNAECHMNSIGRDRCASGASSRRYGNKPREGWGWSQESFRRLFGFGSRLLAAGLLDVIYRNLYLVVIGKVYKSADLGYFVRARQFASMPAVSVGEIFRAVSLPALSRVSDDEESFRKGYLRTLRMAAYVVMPLMAYVGFFSYPLIVATVGSQWGDAASLLPSLSIGLACFPLSAVCLQAVQAQGRSDYFLHAEIWKKVVGVALLAIGVKFGISALAVTYGLACVAGLLIDMAFNARCSGVGVLNQLKSVAGITLLSLAGGFLAQSAAMFCPIHWGQLAIGMASLLLLYIIVSHSLKLQEYRFLLNQIRQIFGK